MGEKHPLAGVFLLLLTLVFFSAKYAGARRQGPVRWWGWAGSAIILVAEVLLFRRVPWVTTFFTPIVWTGYLLLIDALVWSLRRESRLARAPKEFASLAFWSVPLWLVLEAYNLRLENWDYVGVPESLITSAVGCTWAYATIWPAIFETADFVRELGLSPCQRSRPITFSARSRAFMCALGLLSVTVPLLVPTRVGSYLFGAVWLGFILLLDPFNYRWKGQSILHQLEQGEFGTLVSFLVSGWVCGILWEFWNYWAGARWIYVFPIWQDWKIFEMPLPGFFGFPAFAVECFVMYEFLHAAWAKLRGLRSPPVLFKDRPV